MDDTISWYMLLMLIGIPSIITLFVQLLIQHIKDRKEKKQQADTNESHTWTLMQEAMQALLRDRLVEHYKYYTKKKWIDIDDKNNFANMYDKYHKLGKNGVMDQMYEEIMHLPTTPPVRKTKKSNELVTN